MGIRSGVPYLVRLKGSRILDQPLSDQSSGCWTLGEYVKSVFKSTSNMKLGVALLEVRHSLHLIHSCRNVSSLQQILLVLTTIMLYPVLY